MSKHLKHSFSMFRAHNDGTYGSKPTSKNVEDGAMDMTYSGLNGLCNVMMSVHAGEDGRSNNQSAGQLRKKSVQQTNNQGQKEDNTEKQVGNLNKTTLRTIISD